jgi:hypothetical protein
VHQPGEPAASQSGDAPGQQHAAQDEQHPVGDQGELRERRRPAEHDLDDRRADECAVHALRPAEHGARDERDGEREHEVVRRDEAVEQHEQAAGHAGRDRTEHVDGQLGAVAVDPERAGQHGALPEHPQGAAVSRDHHVAHDREPRHQAGDRHQEEAVGRQHLAEEGR